MKERFLKIKLVPEIKFWEFFRRSIFLASATVMCFVSMFVLVAVTDYPLCPNLYHAIPIWFEGLMIIVVVVFLGFFLLLLAASVCMLIFDSSLLESVAGIQEFMGGGSGLVMLMIISAVGVLAFIKYVLG
ncbi:MAG: hypothetical protein PHE43_03430 [Candidatus Nanoarchaeia archaeon]|nr:hypothetical protein [Candidatus Nanoarchaeia archaeon]